jgi:hypothetical protein
VSQAVDNLDDISMLDMINGFLDRKILPVWSLDDPPIVDILECEARHLLLVTGPLPSASQGRHVHGCASSKSCRVCGAV